VNTVPEELYTTRLPFTPTVRKLTEK